MRGGVHGLYFHYLFIGREYQLKEMPKNKIDLKFCFCAKEILQPSEIIIAMSAEYL